MTKSKKNVCMNPLCNSHGKIYSRGLCKKCYNAANNAVHAGHVTWTGLERGGKCLKPTRRSGCGGGRRHDARSLWFLVKR